MDIEAFQRPIGYPALFALLACAVWAVTALRCFYFSSAAASLIAKPFTGRSILDARLLGWTLHDAVALHHMIGEAGSRDLRAHYERGNDWRVPLAVSCLSLVALWTAWPREFRAKLAFLFAFPVLEFIVDVLEGRYILFVLERVATDPEGVLLDKDVDHAATLGGGVLTPLKFALGWATFSAVAAGFAMRFVAAPEEESRFAWLLRSRAKHEKQLQERAAAPASARGPAPAPPAAAPATLTSALHPNNVSAGHMRQTAQRAS
jgi:hypothetical protein